MHPIIYFLHPIIDGKDLGVPVNIYKNLVVLDSDEFWSEVVRLPELEEPSRLFRR